jgi:hypothetical protein
MRGAASSDKAPAIAATKQKEPTLKGVYSTVKISLVLLVAQNQSRYFLIRSHVCAHMHVQVLYQLHYTCTVQEL